MKHTILGFTAVLGFATLMTQCAKDHQTPESLLEQSRTNPLEGMSFFVDENSSAAQVAKNDSKLTKEEKAILVEIAKQPAALWFGEWSGDIEAAASQAVESAEAKQQNLVAVLYNVPYRDCGQYSKGGLEPDRYRAWIDGFIKGLADHRAVIVLEPDAIPLINCLNSETREQRWSLLRYAAKAIKTKTNAALYIDIGHSNWVPAPKMIYRLEQIGFESFDGFALNTSNYQTTESNLAYGKRILAAFPGKGLVIDTSRNGNGPTADNAWCNPRGRALGLAPQVVVDSPDVHAYLWVKRPGESDGDCNGGPQAGSFWKEVALELVRNARPKAM